MKSVKLALFALTAGVALSACSDQAAPISPLAATSPDLAVAPVNGQHLVLFRQNGLPADLRAQVASLGGEVVYSHGPAGFAVVSGLTPKAATKFAGRADVAKVQSDVMVALDEPSAKTRLAAVDLGAASQSNPATALFYSLGWQWNMDAIDADVAWAAGKLGSSAVTVAILDTGIDYDIVDLAGLVDLSRSVSFVPEDTVLLRQYFPTLTNRHAIQDLNGHGTNVASQVSSKAVILAGVTSRTTLIGVKVLGADGSGSFADILAGVLYAADQRADVINMSLGGSFLKAGNGRFVELIERAFNYAAKQKSVVVVAAGNESNHLDYNGDYYAAYCDAPHVLCVSAVGPETATGAVDVRSFYSNIGQKTVNVVAPGGNGSPAASDWPWGRGNYSFVWSFCSKTTLLFDENDKLIGSGGCESGGYLNGFIGTSQATPHVSGLAALLAAEGTYQRPTLIKNQIVRTAVDLGPPGPDDLYGRGLINVARALSLK